MSEFDSILKEKKKYQEPELLKVKKKKRFPYLVLDFIFIVLILIGSYIVYYRNVLAPDKIFMSDISRIIEEYKNIFQYFPIQDVNSDYYFEGTLSLDEKEYNYNIIRNQDKLKIDFSIQEDSLLYYLDNQNQYIKLSNLGEDYIKLDKNVLEGSSAVQESFSTYITEEQYIKKFYLDGYTPVVEVILVLENEDITNLISTNLGDQYEVLFTFKNHAFTNEVISMKMVINNLTTNKRELITYQDGEITYSDGEKINLKFVLSRKNNDFSLKIYQSEVLYSVLSGMKQEDRYQYIYQVIDEIYNISLTVTKGEHRYVYDLTSNIENDGVTTTKNAILTLNQKDNILLEEVDVELAKDFKTFTEDEKKAYEEALNGIIGNLRKFIDEY